MILTNSLKFHLISCFLHYIDDGGIAGTLGQSLNPRSDHQERPSYVQFLSTTYHLGLQTRPPPPRRGLASSQCGLILLGHLPKGLAG